MLLSSALAALGATVVAALPPLVVQGNYFVNPATNSRFQIVGVAYQPGGSAGYSPANGRDPLSVMDNCLRDAALMQQLGVNTVRVYNVDPNLNHDECASIFNAAGMYMIIDVNSPLVGESLTSFQPWTSYYAAYLNRTFAVVEAFKNYPNTLAFFSGNEVINNAATGAAVPPYVRAVTRDLKTYVSKHSSRPIAVGYSAADVRDVLFDSYNYFQCAEGGDAKDMSRADIFALNSYSWCGDSSFKTAGYDTLIAGFNGSSVPVFFSEVGCNVPSPRVFTEIAAIYGPQMANTFSGGVVYEYAQEANNYGLVQISGDDGSATLLPDFITLKAQFGKLNQAEIQGTKLAPGTTPPAPPVCDPSLIKTTSFAKSFSIPALPPGAQDIIDKGVSPAPVGKLIQIKSWAVTKKVLNVDGSVMNNLVVKPVADDSLGHSISSGATASNGTPVPTKSGSGSKSTLIPSFGASNTTWSSSRPSATNFASGARPNVSNSKSTASADVTATAMPAVGPSTNLSGQAAAATVANNKNDATSAPRSVAIPVALGLFAAMAFTGL